MSGVDFIEVYEQTRSADDDFDEGETEFLFQQRKVTPRIGNLLIAPTVFTLSHRGNRP